MDKSGLKVRTGVLQSKLVRYFDQQVVQPIETLRPIVAPSLRSGCYSPGPTDFYLVGRFLVSVSNY